MERSEGGWELERTSSAPSCGDRASVGHGILNADGQVSERCRPSDANPRVVPRHTAVNSDGRSFDLG